MNQASRIIGRIAADVISQERIACGAWKRAVGKRIASRTRAAKLVRDKLVVEVEDQVWRTNLFSLRYQILRNLEKAIEPGIVNDIEFRVVPPRIQPGRAGRSDGQSDAGDHLTLQPLDEADSIADPGLRRIYRASRRKATA